MLHEDLTRLVSYDADTGVFTRNTTVKGYHRGDVMGAKHGDGYVSICINYKVYRAHRLAWFYITKEWPTHQIDHINGVRSDNRFLNLREVSNSENCQNLRKAKSHNVSGYLGVCWNKRDKVYTSSIQVNGVIRKLGRFSDPQEAHQAYLHAKRSLHPFCTI